MKVTIGGIINVAERDAEQQVAAGEAQPGETVADRGAGEDRADRDRAGVEDAVAEQTQVRKVPGSRSRSAKFSQCTGFGHHCGGAGEDLVLSFRAEASIQ